MDSKKEKKPWLLIIGTVVEFLIILGYRCSTYLSEYVQQKWCFWFNTVFRGLYGFLESFWLIESIVLVIFLSVLIKNAPQNRISWRVILCVCSMLFMSLGIYSINVVDRHIKDLISGTQRILETLSGVDFSVLVGWIFAIILSVLAVHFILKLLTSHEYTSRKKTNFISSNRELNDATPKKRVLQAPEVKGANSTAAITDDKTEQIEDETSTAEQEKTINDQAGESDQAGKSQESDSGTWWIQIPIFLLAVPIFIVLVFSALQSNWMSNLNIFGDTFKDNASINSIVKTATPIAMICMALLVAGCFTFLVLMIRNCIYKGSLSHPQALATVLIEIVFIILSPWLKKVNIFDHFLGEMADGNLVGTIVTLVVFYVVTWVFLVIISAARHNTLEEKVKNKCKNLFERIQKLGIGLVDSAVRVIEFATIDYIQSIFGVFGIDSEQKDDKNDSPNDEETNRKA